MKAKRNAEQPVPRLDLAPKLNRPLQLWNPLDYLRLLYWCFFFPQALRWYVETFADPGHRKATDSGFLTALREDPTLGNLALQSLILIPLTSLSSAVGLQLLGIPVDWGVATVGVVVSVVFGVVWGVVGGVGFGVPAFVTGGVAAGVSSFIASGAIAVLWFDLVNSATISMAFGVALSVMYGAVFGAVFGTMLGFASDVRVIVPPHRIAGTISGMMLLRMPDYFALALPSARAWAGQGQGTIWRASRVVSLPLPKIQKRLEAWLVQDWTAGLANINQLMAYTLQIIPVVEAVNAALPRLPEESLLAAVSELAHKPFNWNLVCFGSVSLHNAIWQRRLSNVPRSIRRRCQARFPVEPRLDTPARAACAGFWYLHEKEPVKASEAFAVVRPLPGGEELYLIATLAAAMEAKDAAAVGRWLEPSDALAALPEPYLRPATVRTLRRLREVAQEADMAAHAHSPLMRSSSIWRAVAALTQLLADADETCPQPERAIVKTVAEQWRDVLAAAGGQFGEQVLRQPVENPYEGYSGLPVESTFVGREDVLAQLERLWAAAAPLPPIILYGHRRMGKTSIIHYLHRHRSPETLIARNDMQDLALADDTGQLLLGFARAIHAAAREAHIAAGRVPAAIYYATTGEARMALNALLEQLSPQMAGRRLTLAVDEYEIAEEKIREGKFDPDFLRYLRGAAQRYRWLGLLFAGRQSLEDELRHYQAVFFGSAEPVPVSFLTREAALRLIRRPSDDFALEYEATLAEELYRLTNGQPYLLQRLCWEMVNRWNDSFLQKGEETPRVLTLTDLEALLTPDFYHDFFLQADYYFSGVWSEAGPDEHRLLAALAAREDDALISRAELVEETGLSPNEAETAIEAALRHDLIVKENEYLRLAVPLMRRWVQVYPRSQNNKGS